MKSGRNRQVFSSSARFRVRIASVCLLALFVQGAWLTPLLHQAQCEHAHAPLCTDLEAIPRHSPDSPVHETPCEEQDPAPIDRRHGNCSICKIAKTTTLCMTGNMPVLPVLAPVLQSCRDASSHHTDFTQRLPDSRGPPALS